MKVLSPSDPSDRFEVYRFFNGLSAELQAAAVKRKRVPSVKSFLLEHVAARGNGTPKPPHVILENLDVESRRIDDNFYSLVGDVVDSETKKITRATTGYLEQYNDRFFAYYTCEESVEAKKRVAKWVQAPDLDFTWFSSPLLQALWDKDVSSRGDNRFGKLVFKHESIFDMPTDFAEAENEEGDEDQPQEMNEEEVDLTTGSDEDRIEIERRNARFEMGDRIGRIKKSLVNLQNNYDPLYALFALRIPSLTCHGGHDLYQAGQITNRTDSFEDHRNTVRYLYRLYKSILERTEEYAWHDLDKNKAVKYGMMGAPLIVKFNEPLNQATFDRWVKKAFQKRNRFKLWGEPIRLGPKKVHVYGADRHLWQPINLEITTDGIVAILPQGTCGNTFHRLVANIQHYVCPKIEAWVGRVKFENIVSAWSSMKEESHEN